MTMLEAVTFGEILWDLFEDHEGRFVPRLGGAPANVAVQLARLGLRAAVIGGVGTDFLGEGLTRELEEAAVDTRTLLRKDERTGVVFIRRDRHGEPHFLFYRENSADMIVSARDIRAVFRPSRLVHVSTSTLSRPALKEATYALLSRAKGLVVCDLNVRLRMWKSRRELRAEAEALLSRSHLVKASDGDLRVLGFSSTEAGLRWLLPRVPLLLLTRGPKVAELFVDGKSSVRVPTRPVKVVDATGAGDAFLAGVLAVLLQKKAIRGTVVRADAGVWRSAILFGHLMGAKVVTEVGSVEATRQVRPLRRALATAVRSC